MQPGVSCDFDIFFCVGVFFSPFSLARLLFVPKKSDTTF